MYPIAVPLSFYGGSPKLFEDLRDRVALMALRSLLENKPYGFDFENLFVVLNKDYSLIVVPVFDDNEHVANSVVFRLSEEEFSANLLPAMFPTKIGEC
jgi:hypothetical protein